MVDSAIPIKVTLQDDNGTDVASATVMAPGSHTFKDLTPGATYRVKFSAPAPYQVKPPKPDCYTLANKQNALKITVGLDCIIVPNPAIEGLSIPPPSLPPPPPGDSPTLSAVLAGAAVAALSLVLLADVSGFIGTVRSPAPVRPTPQGPSIISNRPTNISNRSTNRVPRSNRRLPRDLEERLQECLEEAFKSQSELLQKAEEIGLTTDPATLVPLLIGVEQEEPTDPAIILIRDLKAAIEDCDPSLLEAILEAEEQNADSPSVKTVQGTGTQNIGFIESNQLIAANQVWIIGTDVNVRVSPHLDSPIVAQVSEGVVSIDRALTAAEGWLPIVLPNGQKGYVSTRYVSISAPNQ